MNTQEQIGGGSGELQIIQPELKSELFSCPVRTHLLHELVRMHLASMRQGTSATKTKGLVRGGGKKPWKQKGTGRARAGSIRSPLWVGGGTVFGPQPKKHAYRLPRSARVAGLKSALSWKKQTGKLVVVEDFELPQVKTKCILSLLSSVGLKDVLFVIPEENKTIERSARNLPSVEVVKARAINVYDILRHHTVLLTKRSLDALEKKLER